MESTEKTAWLSILTNLLLVGIKTAVVLISGSLAVTADAIHSLSDVVASIITWLFSSYELQKGKETGSPSLIADARHIWTDMLSSLVILIVFLGSAIGFAIDKYAAVIVVVFIARSAVIILLDSVRVLLDASLDFSSLSRIREIVLADSRVLEINNIWARNVGRYKFVEWI